MPRSALLTALLLHVLFSAQANAKGSSSLNSELSHVAGGGAFTVGISLLTEKYWPEQNSTWVGFTVSSAFGILSQYYEYDHGTNTASEAALDALSHVVGSAIGAYISEEYLITPEISPEPDGGTSLGIALHFDF